MTALDSEERSTLSQKARRGRFCRGVFCIVLGWGLTQYAIREQSAGGGDNGDQRQWFGGQWDIDEPLYSDALYFALPARWLFTAGFLLVAIGSAPIAGVAYDRWFK